MKWGVRRYRDKNGKLTAAGKSKYGTDRMIGRVGRAMSNTSAGQRLIGVGINKGYRQDRKEIKSTYKSLKSKTTDKQQLKSLKNDYKKTKAEARTVAADALYPWQSQKTNEKIQSQNLGKSLVKSALLGYGSTNYDRLTANGGDRVTSSLVAIGSGAVDHALMGWVGAGDHYVGEQIYKKS